MNTTLERLEDLAAELDVGVDRQAGIPAAPRDQDVTPSGPVAIPAADPSAPRPTWRPSLRSLGLAWLLIAGSLIAFEPTPPDPNAPIPAWAALLGSLFLAGVAAALGGLFLRRSWTPSAFLVAGLAGLALAAGCLGTEHHSMPYPMLEVAGFGALTWLSWRARGGSFGEP